MSINWGYWDVRVYVTETWVSLASRFAEDHPIIVDRLEAALADPAPAVRLQVAQNLQVIHAAAPERMWAMSERILATESDAEVIAGFLNDPMQRLSFSEPERCEALLRIVKERLDGDLIGDVQGRDRIQESLGTRAAQLYVWQGRPLAGAWLEEWCADPVRYRQLLDAISFSLREMLFARYAPATEVDACARCDRAQQYLTFVISAAKAGSAEADRVMASEVNEADKRMAGQRYVAAEAVINQAMKQLYFGSGAHANNSAGGPGLPDSSAMARFLTDYSGILTMLSASREPSTLHHLIELYEFLIPGGPAMVFDAVHAILLGRGEEERYHYESLGSTVVVRIVQRYIADYRAIFEDEGRRARLVAIIQLFSEVGWPDALKLLYEIPDLLR